MALANGSTWARVKARAQILADQQRGMTRAQAAEELARNINRIRQDLTRYAEEHGGGNNPRPQEGPNGQA